MMKHREKRGLMSRLPEDEAYWESLTDRLVRDAAGRLSTSPRPATRWWGGLARRSTPLAVGAAAAVIAALLWPKVGGAPPRGSSPPLLYGFAPTDPLAAAFVTSAAAPTIATLWAASTSEGTP